MATTTPWRCDRKRQPLETTRVSPNLFPRGNTAGRYARRGDAGGARIECGAGVVRDGGVEEVTASMASRKGAFIGVGDGGEGEATAATVQWTGGAVGATQAVLAPKFVACGGTLNGSPYGPGLAAGTLLGNSYTRRRSISAKSSRRVESFSCIRMISWFASFPRRRR